MRLRQNTDETVIEKDVHCPYCDKDEALLISKMTSKRLSLQSPAYGLKFLLSVVYLYIYPMIHGFKIIETTKKTDSITYVFCPHCGNTYSLGAPEVIKEEVHEPKFYRIKKRKVCMGMCTGISEYTGIPLLWVRIMTVFYGLMIIGLFLYFLVGMCVPYKDDAENGTDKGKFYRIKSGKDIKGVCKGFAVHNDISVGWVRLITLILAPLMLIPYFITVAAVPYKENAENGKVRKKLRKTHDKKVIFGLCAGFTERFGKPRWMWRIFAVPLFPVYFILSAVIPTKED